ncbi:CLUMA_CG012499, isoform A [Clunio marinus]|uniref:CLUMA_CG012499, isoform A n=1 Tax=Clunio marinus TaxID=568069 RepID=A0A1J1II52_9DIPT|nr:CLUMA_CG012499, isoform A [Clunio marinus]
MNVKNENTKRKYRVVIIGAGAAGLSAANSLIKNGLDDFVILEARNRIGGRINSIELGSQKVEMGANWIHGVLGNPIFEFAMSHGLVDILQTPQHRRVVALSEDGKQVSFEVLQEIYEAYLVFLRRCEEYFLAEYVPPDNIFSVGQHIQLEIDLYLKSISNDKDKHLREMIFKCLLKRECCITGCHSMDEIDLLELGSYTELQGGNIILPSGYSSILTPLRNNLPQEAIILNCPVKTIKWKKKKTVITSPSGLNQIPEEIEDSDGNNSESGNAKGSSCVQGQLDSRVQIVCETNEEFFADHVICTIPLGVLKESPNLFDPPLPDYKQESIQNLLYGTVNKIFLQFDRPFLNQDISEILLLWNDDVQSKESTEEQIKNFWYRKIYSFSKISETFLLGWISGKEAEYMETLDDKIVSDKCTELLKKFLKDPCIPAPIKCIRTTWKSQTYSRGIYYSTVHGAYLSGRSAAQVIYTPESPQEIVMVNDSSDLSSWIQGIQLE